MECGIRGTRGTGTYGASNIVIYYEIEAAGIYAMKAATDLAIAVAENKSYHLEYDLQHFQSIKSR